MFAYRWAGDVGGVQFRLGRRWIWNHPEGQTLSSETMLAVTVKKDHHEETRCVLVHLGGLILRQKALLVLDSVLSFGKIYYNWNFLDKEIFFSSSNIFSLCRMGHRWRPLLQHTGDASVPTCFPYSSQWYWCPKYPCLWRKWSRVSV